jgi:hypothetical protein
MTRALRSFPSFAFVSLLSFAALAIACGGDDGGTAATPAGSAGNGGQAAAAGGGGAPQSNLGYRDYQTKVIAAGCERDVRCATGTKTEAECLAAYDTPDTTKRIDVFAQGIEEGRIAFDPDAAEATLIAYAGFACNKGLDLIKLQNTVLAGLVKEGSACFAHVECARVDATLSGSRLCVSGCDFLTGETGAEGTCQESPIATGVCPSK